MKNKDKICATLSMIAADGRHVEIAFTDKDDARATMDALESGVIPRQAVTDRCRLPRRAWHAGPQAHTGRDQRRKPVRPEYRGFVQAGAEWNAVAG